MDDEISSSQHVQPPTLPTPPTPPPATPLQVRQDKQPITPIKAEQTGITPRYRDFDTELVNAFNKFYTLIRSGPIIAKSAIDQQYFNGRIEEYRRGLDQLVSIRLGGKKKSSSSRNTRRRRTRK